MVTFVLLKKSVTIFQTECKKNPNNPGIATSSATSNKLILPQRENIENIWGKNKNKEIILICKSVVPIHNNIPLIPKFIKINIQRNMVIRGK